MAIICKNCNHRYKGRYCNNCGQSAETHDINVRYLWHDIQHGIFHFDKGIFFTIKQLFIRPGHTIREFIDGKRIKYFKPIAFVFILSTIYGLVSHFLKVNAFLGEVTFEFTDDEKNNFIYLVSKVHNWLQAHYAYSALIFLPIFSFASYLVFRKSGFNYIKHLVLNAYLTGQRTLINLFFLPLLAQIHNKIIISNIQNTKLIIGILFTTWAYTQFFNKNSTIKNIFLTLLTYFLLIGLFIVSLVIVAILAEV